MPAENVSSATFRSPYSACRLTTPAPSKAIGRSCFEPLIDYSPGCRRAADPRLPVVRSAFTRDEPTLTTMPAQDIGGTPDLLG